MPRRLVILGSTGSIGRSALQVVAALPGEFKIVGLAAGSRWQELARQAGEWQPEFIALGDPTQQDSLCASLNGEINVLCGARCLVELVEQSNCDIVLSAIVGTAGLLATIRAVELGKRVALANKETLVVAGSLITSLAQRSGAELIPVDSEHSAIFQALRSGRQQEVRKIYLTSSGGPFRTWSRQQIREATRQDAMAHPVWDMGPKITIDSATMMNKALEIVEARWLFGVPCSKIEVLIHPEAIIHSMVEFHDGCLVAQLGLPDMRIPIQYALTYPRRLPGCSPSLDFSKLRRLNFEPPDPDRFPALRLGCDVAEKGGTAGAVVNAANEAAVEAFGADQIKFDEITQLSADTLRRHHWIRSPSLEEILEADAWARNEVKECLRC